MKDYDIVFVSGLPWSFVKQRHHHVARRLAIKNRVFFIEPQVSIITQLRSKGGKRVVNCANSLYLIKPYPGVPFKKRLPWLYPLNGLVAAVSVKNVLNILGLKRHILWVTTPEGYFYINILKNDLVVYDCLDDFASFPGVPGGIISCLDRRLSQAADIVFATANKLFEMKSTLNQNCHLIPNGVDCELFSQHGGGLETIFSLGKPVIGYIGVISDWLDFELIRVLATNRPHYSFVFVGPLKTRLPPNLPDNVHFLGQYPYEQIPAVIRSFDVGIIPFLINPLTTSTNPVKVYEYLAIGIPVVSSDLPELRPMAESGYVGIAGSTIEWLSLLDQAVEEQNAAMRQARRSFAMNCASWESRIQAMETVINLKIGEN